MEKRWLIFFVVTYAILMYFLPRLSQAPPPEAPEGKEGSAAVEADGVTTATQALAPHEEPELRREKEIPRPVAPKPVEEYEEKKVEVGTDCFDVVFSTRGAVPVSWEITDARYVNGGESRDGAKGIELIPTFTEGQEYPLEVALKEANGGYLNELNYRNYQVETSEEPDGSKKLVFRSPLVAEGIRLVKEFEFKPNSYLVNVTLKLKNESDSRYRFEDGDGRGLGLAWGPGLGLPNLSGRHEASFSTTLFLTDNGIRYERPTKKGEVYIAGDRVAWAGLQSKYFLAAMIPVLPEGVEFGNFRGQSLVKVQNLPSDEESAKKIPTMTTELYGEGLKLEPSEMREFRYSVFVGPKQRGLLKSYDHDLDKSLFYDSWEWMRALCIFLMGALWLFEQYTGNYGWAIILVTIALRVVIWPATYKGMKSQGRFMAQQLKLKPEMEELNKVYKNNPQKKNQEVWKLYKKHNVNPLGMFKGCIFLLIQLPIFIALYKILDQAVELRGASFWWIDDLSKPDALFHFGANLPILGDAFNLLPIVLGLSQYLYNKYATFSVSSDPMQKQMMSLMPIMFIFIMYHFPAGLTLYWLISNFLQVGSQLLVNKMIKKDGEPVGAVAAKA
ncbi:MAG: YidC/Oxa1 family insertase periplasmic-domain containing protein [bacterium]